MEKMSFTSVVFSSIKQANFLAKLQQVSSFMKKPCADKPELKMRDELDGTDLFASNIFFLKNVFPYMAFL